MSMRDPISRSWKERSIRSFRFDTRSVKRFNKRFKNIRMLQFRKYARQRNTKTIRKEGTAEVYTHDERHFNRVGSGINVNSAYSSQGVWACLTPYALRSPSTGNNATSK